jgi:hypothetical protein
VVAGKAKDWKGKGAEVMSGKTYSHALGKSEPTFKTYPFAVLGKENLSATPTAICNTIWIKRWDRNKMDKLWLAAVLSVAGKVTWSRTAVRGSNSSRQKSPASALR